MVTIVDKKATAAQEAVRLRDEAQKRKDIKAELALRKQALKERQYDNQVMLMDLSALSEEDAAYFRMMKEEIRQKRMGNPPKINSLLSSSYLDEPLLFKLVYLTVVIFCYLQRIVYAMNSLCFLSCIHLN